MKSQHLAEPKSRKWYELLCLTGRGGGQWTVKWLTTHDSPRVHTRLPGNGAS